MTTTFKGFHTFLLEAKSKMVCKYPFLSHDQIMCRLRLQWKKLQSARNRSAHISGSVKKNRSSSGKSNRNPIVARQALGQNDTHSGTISKVDCNIQQDIESGIETDENISTDESASKYGQNKSSPYMKNKDLIDKLNSELYNFKNRSTVKQNAHSPDLFDEAISKWKKNPSTENKMSYENKNHSGYMPTKPKKKATSKYTSRSSSNSCSRSRYSKKNRQPTKCSKASSRKKTKLQLRRQVPNTGRRKDYGRSFGESENVDEHQCRLLRDGADSSSFSLWDDFEMEDDDDAVLIHREDICYNDDHDSDENDETVPFVRNQPPLGYDRKKNSRKTNNSSKLKKKRCTQKQMSKKQNIQNRPKEYNLHVTKTRSTRQKRVTISSAVAKNSKGQPVFKNKRTQKNFKLSEKDSGNKQDDIDNKKKIQANQKHKKKLSCEEEDFRNTRENKGKSKMKLLVKPKKTFSWEGEEEDDHIINEQDDSEPRIYQQRTKQCKSKRKECLNNESNFSCGNGHIVSPSGSLISESCLSSTKTLNNSFEVPLDVDSQGSVCDIGVVSPELHSRSNGYSSFEDSKLQGESPRAAGLEEELEDSNTCPVKKLDADPGDWMDDFAIKEASPVNCSQLTEENEDEDTQLNDIQFGELFSDPPSSTEYVDPVTPSIRQVSSGARIRKTFTNWFEEEMDIFM